MLDDRELERALVGAILVRPAVVEDLAGEIRPHDFNDAFLASVFEAACSLAERGEPVDTVSISAKPGRPDVELWEQLSDMGDRGLHVTRNVAYHARRLRKLSHARQIAVACGEVFDDAKTVDPDTYQDHAAAKLGPLLVAQQSADPVDVGHASTAVLRDIFSSKPPGVPTHYRGFDLLLQGLQPDKLYIVAGRPAMGKSAFALNLARACGLPTLYVSLEMAADELIVRDLCRCSSVDISRAMARVLNDHERASLVQARQILGEQDFEIDDRSTMQISEIRSSARSFVRRRGLAGARVPALIVVDYLQIVAGSGKGRSREEDVSEISRGLKNLSRELHVPVVAASQLNRDVERRTSHRPMLADLRESGSLEQDADVVLGLYRPEVYTPDAHKGLCEVIVLKQRNGPVGSFWLGFEDKCTRFTEPPDRSATT